MYQVSALVSTYNSERFILHCLEDLCAQSLYKKGELEIVVVVSGSPQNEKEIVESYRKSHPHIVCITTERETMYGAWNRGLTVAKGKYLTNANTDDRRHPESAEILSRSLNSHPEVDVVYADCYVSNIENETYTQNSKQSRYCYPRFFAPGAVLHYQLGPQAMWRKDLHEKIGPFSSELRAAGDYDFNLKVALKAKALRYEGDALGLYLAHGEAISFKDSTMKTETDKLVAQYRESSMIEALYAREGVVASTPDARAAIHLDMGIRALQYFPPWFFGNSHSEPLFAIECFRRALENRIGGVDILNNLAIAYLLAGDTSNALSLAEDLLKKTSIKEVIQNSELIKTIVSGAKEVVPNFILAPSGLALPSQRELSL